MEQNKPQKKIVKKVVKDTKPVVSSPLVLEVPVEQKTETVIKKPTKRNNVRINQRAE